MKNKTQQEQTERTEIKEISLLTLLPPVQTRHRTIALLAEMFQGFAHRRAGNFDHALQRVVHLQDNKNRARHGQRADEQHGDHGRIARCEQAKTQVQHGKPEEKHH